MTNKQNVTETELNDFFARGGKITKYRDAVVVSAADRRFKKWNGWSRDAARIARLNMLA
jgi:hypothetical protein